MKSLKESLFDDDLVTKMTKFCDLYELAHTNINIKIHPLAELYKSSLIMKDSKVGGKWNSEDAIVYGLAKLVEDIKLLDLSNKSLNAELMEFNKYYKSIVFKTRRLHARSLPYAYNNDPGAWRNGKLENWEVGDVQTIKICFCNIELTFKRK